MAYNWHRLRVLGIASCIIIGPLVSFLGWALIPIATALQQASSDTQTIQHLRNLAAEKPAYQAALTRAKTKITGSGALYTGSSAELASATLQNTLQDLVTQAGGQITSSAIEPPQTGHGLQTLSVSLTLTLPAGQLPLFLKNLDAQKPWIIADSLDIRSYGFGVITSDLNIQMQIKAFGETE